MAAKLIGLQVERWSLWCNFKFIKQLSEEEPREERRQWAEKRAESKPSVGEVTALRAELCRARDAESCRFLINSSSIKCSISSHLQWVLCSNLWVHRAGVGFLGCPGEMLCAQGHSGLVCQKPVQLLLHFLAAANIQLLSREWIFSEVFSLFYFFYRVMWEDFSQSPFVMQSVNQNSSVFFVAFECLRHPWCIPQLKSIRTFHCLHPIAWQGSQQELFHI